MNFLIFLLFWLVCFNINICLAEDNNKTPVTAPAATQQKITDVYLLGLDSLTPPSDTSIKKCQSARQTFGINDTLVVQYDGLESLIEKQKNIELYLDGKKVAIFDLKNGIAGRKPNTVEFDLSYGDSTNQQNAELYQLIKKNWASLLGSPTFFNARFFDIPVEVAIGSDNKIIVDYPQTITLKRISLIPFLLSSLVLVIFVVIFWKSKKLRNILHDSLSDSGPKPCTGDFKPWSLARCQMAFWFMLVTVSFLSIWIVNGALDTITNSVLALIGIGSGSALGSAFIDASQNDQENNEKFRQRINEIEKTKNQLADKIKQATELRLNTYSNQGLEKLRDSLAVNVKKLSDDTSLSDDIKASLTAQIKNASDYINDLDIWLKKGEDINAIKDVIAEKEKDDKPDDENKSLKRAKDLLDTLNTQKQEIDNLKAQQQATEKLNQFIQNQKNNQTNGFWCDILYENESASFHRIQMFVWTLVLGVIFVYSVWKNLSMPDFSSTLLALQGLSAGTYLGFKLPDKA